MRAALAAYAAFRAVLENSHLIDDTMEFSHDPVSAEAGLQRSLDSLPATILVLPSGWVKIVAAVGYVCGDLRRIPLTEAWQNYFAAWHDDTVIAAVRRGISGELPLAAANTWTSIPKGATQTWSM
jgi:hypothetical protein